jgi:molybdate transport system ATP-binding protein
MVMIEFHLYKTLHSANGEMALDVSCKIEQGQLLTIYGASGAGKTTILRMLAGLTQPEKGFINVDSNIWLDINKGIHLPTQKRDIGLVFQGYALFPNMTVEQNLEYALDKVQDKIIIEELIDVMELQQLRKLKPSVLSGGQKQRVALARALVRKPKLLLLDEPLSALDNDMRIKLQDHILEVHRRYKLTTILVSHDVAEIYKMANTVLILENGKIVKHGIPANVFFNRQVSGKFQFTGEVVKIEKEDIIYIVSVLIGNNIVKVVATEDDIKELQQGDKVLVASKAFNPLIKKIGFNPGN